MNRSMKSFLLAATMTVLAAMLVLTGDRCAYAEEKSDLERFGDYMQLVHRCRARSISSGGRSLKSKTSRLLSSYIFSAVDHSNASRSICCTFPVNRPGYSGLRTKTMDCSRCQDFNLN